MVEGSLTYDDNVNAAKNMLEGKSYYSNSNFLFLSVGIPRSDIYTVAFDRRCFLNTTDPFYQRPDIQLNYMIDIFIKILKDNQYEIHDKIFMQGFSNGAMFAQRYCLLHPEKVEAIAVGQCGGFLTLPITELDDIPLYYGIGMNDFEFLTGLEFNLNSYETNKQLDPIISTSYSSKHCHT
jgi:pimeloyl-ACP methyl ester carboxylesterase